MGEEVESLHEVGEQGLLLVVQDLPHKHAILSLARSQDYLRIRGEYDCSF